MEASHAGGVDSEASGHTSFIHSTNSLVTGDRSAILGGQNITGTTNDTVYVPNFNIDSTPSNDNALTQILARDADGSVKYRDASSLGGGGGGTFTGNTSGTCIEDIWVTNIQSCSPLNINPGDEGNVYFGSSSGVTINVADERIGIGTAGSTNYKLWVKDTSTHVQGKIESDNGYARWIIDSQNLDHSVLQFNEANLRRWQIAADGTDDKLKILRQDITTGGTITPAIVIDTNDYVGINTENPTAPLTVDGGPLGGPFVRIEGGGAVYPQTMLQLHDDGFAVKNESIIEFTFSVSGTSGAEISAINEGLYATGGTKLYLQTYYTGGTRNDNQLVLSNDGNVGIGTDNPIEKLQVSGNSSTQIRVDASIGNASLILNAAENAFVDYKEDTLQMWRVGNHQIDDYFKWATGATFNNDSVMQLSRDGHLTVNNFTMLSGGTDGYVLTSDASGNASWGPVSGATTIFTGNTSGTCISELWVTSISGCSPVTLGPAVTVLGEFTIMDDTIYDSLGNTPITFGNANGDTYIHGDLILTSDEILDDSETTCIVFDGLGNTTISGIIDVEGQILSGGTDLVDIFCQKPCNGGGGTFTGNTSGTCIQELWVSTISGCSPVTIGSSIKSSNSTIESDSNSFAFGDGHEINYGNNGAILGGSYCKIVGSGFGSPPKDNTIIGGGYNQMIGTGTPGTIIRSGIFAGGWSGDVINNNTILISGPGSVLQSVIVGGNENTLLTGVNGGDIHNSIVIGGKKNVVGTAMGPDPNRSHYNCGIVGGSGNTISDSAAGLNGAVIIGGQDITAVVSNTVYVPNFNIGTVGGGTSLYNLGIDSTGTVVTGSTSGGGATIDPYNNVGGTNEVYWDVSGTSTNYEITLTGNTILVMSNVRNGDYGTMIAHQDVTGSRTLTFSVGTNYVVNGGGGAPTLTATGGATDILSFTYNGTAFYWTVGNDYT